MPDSYAIGLDYGTSSVRALLVNTATGQELAESTWPYEHGDDGVILARDPQLARQHPADYLKGAELTLKKVVAQAQKKVRGFRPERVVGLGVDTTGSTPLPVDGNGQPLAFDPRFKKNVNALAWLWKDHTGWAEAEEITSLGRGIRPQYLAKSGGVYSDFPGTVKHNLIRGGTLTETGPSGARQIHLRVGIGGIEIQKMGPIESDSGKPAATP